MQTITTRRKWLITLTVMMGTIMSAIDTSIVNVALPHIQGNLGATVEEITWVSTGYILSSVIIMPIVAYLSSYFGRKRFYLFSVMLFTLSSVLCALAWNLGSMVLFRILQGIGGGTLTPVSQAVLRETFPPQEQPMAMGIFGLGVILGPALGPSLGGWLTDHYTWPWIFYINVPIGIINLLMIVRFIEDPPFLIREKGRLDFWGLSLLAAGLGALQIMLEKGNQKDWFASDFILGLALISAISLALFVRQELRCARPAVNLRLLKDINFTSTTILGGILSVVLMGSLFLLPLLLQQLLHYTAFVCGLALMPRSIAMGVAMPFAGRIYGRVGPRWLIATGLLINVISFYQFSRLSLAVGYWDIFVPQALQGVGFGLVFVAISAAAFSSIDKPQLTAASGLHNVIRQVFSSIGIALSATILTHGIGGNRAILGGHVNAYNDTAVGMADSLSSYFYTQGADALTAQAMAAKTLEGLVMGQAGILAYNHVFLLFALLFLLAVPLTFLVTDEHLRAARRAPGDESRAA